MIYSSKVYFRQFDVYVVADILGHRGQINFLIDLCCMGIVQLSVIGNDKPAWELGVNLIIINQSNRISICSSKTLSKENSIIFYTKKKNGISRLFYCYFSFAFYHLIPDNCRLEREKKKVFLFRCSCQIKGKHGMTQHSKKIDKTDNDLWWHRTVI